MSDYIESRVAIQCTTIDGKTGTYLFDISKGVLHAVSPVFSGCVELFSWIKAQKYITRHGVAESTYRIHDVCEFIQDAIDKIESAKDDAGEAIKELRELRSLKTTWVGKKENDLRFKADKLLRDNNHA